MTPEEIHYLRVRAVDELHQNGVKSPTVNQVISKMKSIEARGDQSFETLFGVVRK